MSQRRRSRLTHMRICDMMRYEKNVTQESNGTGPIDSG